MQRLLFTGLLIWVAFSIVSCAEDKYYESSAYPVNNNTNTKVNSNIAVPLHLNGLANIGKGNLKLNPEHGKPGHQCNIAVGAPLNQQNSTPAPGNDAMQKILSLPIQPVSESVTLAPDAPNPAHGKPGHRCDISIGAPLNSKAPSSSSPPVAAVQQPKSVQQPEVVTLPGMNPPHGKPGHRCDIAVGAPLKPGK